MLELETLGMIPTISAVWAITNAEVDSEKNNVKAATSVTREKLKKITVRGENEEVTVGAKQPESISELDKLNKSYTRMDWLKEVYEYDWAAVSYTYKVTSYVDYEFMGMLADICTDLGIKPDYVMAIIMQESAFNPQAENEAGAVGLLQATENGALSELGYTKEQVLAMDQYQQLSTVIYPHFRIQVDRYGPLTTFEDVYMAVFSPVAIGKGSDHNICTAASHPGLNINGGDYVAKGEAVQAIEQKRDEGYKVPKWQSMTIVTKG